MASGRLEASLVGCAADGTMWHIRVLNNLKTTTPPDEIVRQSIRLLISPDRQNEEAGERLEHYGTCSPQEK
jgi:hypothetical protein